MKAALHSKRTGGRGEGGDNRLWWGSGVQGRYTGESLFDRTGRKAAGHHHVHEHGMDPFEWAGACQTGDGRLESDRPVWFTHNVGVLNEQLAELEVTALK